MIGPRNGGTRPISVASPTSQGSWIRRRASLKVQNAVASKRMTTSAIPALRTSVQSGSSKMAARGSTFKAVACRPDSQAQRPHPRSPRRRAPRRPALPGVLPCVSWALELCLCKVTEKVEGAGHEHGLPELVSAGERVDGLLDGLHVPEMTTRDTRQLARRERAPRRRCRRHDAP